jgi:hypothetical protein
MLDDRDQNWGERGGYVVGQEDEEEDCGEDQMLSPR